MGCAPDLHRNTTQTRQALVNCFFRGSVMAETCISHLYDAEGVARTEVLRCRSGEGAQLALPGQGQVGPADHVRSLWISVTGIADRCI